MIERDFLYKVDAFADLDKIRRLENLKDAIKSAHFSIEIQQRTVKEFFQLAKKVNRKLYQHG